MGSPVYLNIRCSTLDEAQSMVEVLRDFRVSAGNIQLPPFKFPHVPVIDLAHRPGRLVVVGAVICSVIGLALVGLTMFLFPLNIFFTAAIVCLGYFLFELSSPAFRPPGTQKLVRSVGNGGIHILVRVTSQTESDQLLIACENILTPQEQHQASQNVQVS